jgi:predicted phage terminase large subunit-like protein
MTTDVLDRTERLATLREKIDRLHIVEARERYEESFSEFLRGAWHAIDTAPFQSCWAIDGWCLPYGATIITSEGQKPIGEIVETGWNGLVLSYNHAASLCEWKPIAYRMESVGKPLLSIKLNDGTSLPITDNHPVFIVGGGYVRADQVEVGSEVVYLRTLQQEVSKETERQRKVLLPSVLRELQKQTDTGGQYKKLQPLWQAILSLPIATAWRILQHAVFRGGKASSGKGHVSNVRWPQGLGFQAMSIMWGNLKEVGSRLRVPTLREAELSHAGSASADNSGLWRLLQQAVHGTVCEGGEPYPVCERSRGQPVPPGFFPSEAKGNKTREEPLLLVCAKGQIGRAPYKPTHDEQPVMEPRRAMSEMPRRPTQAHERRARYAVGTATVVSIEREVSVPTAVYNIEVLDNHNYFAENVLVHNCEHLEAVTLGYIPRLLGNFPPRCAKTKSTGVAWPAWTWARQTKTFLSGPQVKFLAGSYDNRLSLESANLMRRLLMSPWYQKHWGDRFALRVDQNTKTQFDNTKGGSRISTSVRGSLLGLGGDALFADDPHNTETDKKIETDADRMKVGSWWREFSSTRLNDPKLSAIVVAMQRLHQQDLSGIILDGDEDFVHYCVPMEFEERRRCVTVVLPQFDDEEPWEDPRTQEGELMWPERFGRPEVRRLKTNLGPFMAAGRLQQNPIPKGGGIIKRDYWQIWDQVEAQRYGLEWNETRKEFPPFDLVVASVDTAYGDKAENDYNALTIWGTFKDMANNTRVMLMFAWIKRVPLHGTIVTAKAGEAKVNFQQRQQEQWGLVEWIADACKRYRVHRLIIEDKTRGRDVAMEIQRLYAREKWGVELINPVGDKTSRAHAVVAMFADGMIYAPETKWSELVLTNCERFPKDEHDDLLDTVSMYLNWGRDRGILIRADESSAALEDEMTLRHPQDTVAQQYGV